MPEAIGAALRRAAGALAGAGIEAAALEARLLMAHALGVAREGLLDRARLVDVAGFDALLARRLAHEPLAFITGRQGFWTLDLEVSADTLIPRADSETLIDAALSLYPARDAVRVLDLGTGTGCLLLAVLVEFPSAFGVGVDLSPGAAALARRNAVSAGIAGRCAFLAGDWGAALAGRFDLVISNPPYIPGDEVAGLMPEVALHEPLRALDGGVDGLVAYRRILPLLPGLLRPCGRAVLELGQGQAPSVSALAGQNGLAVLGVRRDLGGIERALMLGLPAEHEKSFGKSDGCG
jgi:release factor glutamine methyltransferase